MRLPHPVERACMALYVNREVLQFCDFYCATLSFWVTVVALSAALWAAPWAAPAQSARNGLDLLGAVVIALLVQYNRTGGQAFKYHL